ncbi:hypothetical protein I2494_04290 [Budviciaceae bacterium BWR-B9]|uniref:Uncharacterized protein n=1 Tax=Limnobaculum allomyrinae TaxID=2791986 RepID=A0ABS1IMH0_9GAMM|nr:MULTISPECIES: hypothetical protein [Limnobaculum]MBK5142943.1 hypothetical protein [Limnobaculum allomyrinae]MBV7690170.1 hypothetical protein [Limnobaculum sp. M2-1]
MMHSRSVLRSSPAAFLILLLVLIGVLPLLSQVLAYFCLLLVDSSAWFSRDLVLSEGFTISRVGLLQITRWFCLAVFCLGILAMGHFYGRYIPLPRQRLWRYIPFLIFILYAQVVCTLVLSAGGEPIIGRQPYDFALLACLPFRWIAVHLKEPQWLPLLTMLTYTLFSTGVFTARQQNK